MDQRPTSPRALIVIDVQRGFDDPRWGQRNNPACESNVQHLLEVWQAAGQPIVYVQHDSRVAESPLAATSPGHDFKPELDGVVPDVTVHKSVHSAFHGQPDLDDWLRSRGVRGLVISGIQTNMCCETTARVAADLGYEVTFALDATHTFDLQAPDGATVTADELARITATNLATEFATVVSTAELLASAPEARAAQNERPTGRSV